LASVAEQPLHRALGLTDGELDRICELLERDPNHFELAVFSLLWSEHCGYKHSALLLKRLPSTGERVLQGPGENAGVLDLGDGEAVAFKVESHNHPSAVEPFQGAATGVGGILRDIVAMGARPIALLDGLRFGDPGWQFDRAVAGIGHYGNCVGVPTVGGEAVFDEAYADNCLVNAMCVGLVDTERLTRARASGPGNVVLLFGATTGRDGIGGASVLASQELGEGSDEKRPSVQVGDPFTGKKLIEVSLELTEGGLVESLQDCGAAGLASSLAEMARDGAGIDVHLDRVPLRENEMEPWEIMISESQERMVAVVRPTMLAAVEAICDRWELHHARIGEVTDTGELRAFHSGETLAEIPAELLTDEAPRYRIEPEPRPPAEPALHAVGLSAEDALLALMGSPNIRSRAWIYRQYDHIVGSRTVRRPGLDAAVLRLRPSMRGLAVSLDGTGAVGRLDPYTGGARAVLEAARNVACVGGEPLGLTDCLNFGNPEKGEIAWELEQSIAGMADAAVALGIPVVSGNVSLYNETDGRPIHPTPVVGCVGLVKDVRETPRGWQEGDLVLLAGEPRLMLDGSALQQLHGKLEGRPARVDLDADALLVRFLWSIAPRCSLVHDVADGGLAVALAEAALWSGVGAKLDLPEDPLSLFGEGGGQAILAAPPDVARRIKGVPLRVLGEVGGDSICGVSLDRLQEVWTT
jgi:phosphoribosylformylglycinamidine synthase